MSSNGSPSRSAAGRWVSGSTGLACAVLALLVLSAASPASAIQSQSDTVSIDPGEHAAVEIDFRDGPTKDVSYEVRVQEGPNIDVLLLDNANYQKYKGGDSFEYVEAWSDLDTGNTVNDFRLDQHGTWWLVLDHTDEPDEGTSPATVGAESVTAGYTLEAETNVTDEARDRLDKIPVPGAMILVGLVGGVALVASTRDS